MINFRFHLVSLIAVFLALGLGMLVGSTVVDPVIFDRLDREISSVSHESSQIKSDNGALQDQLTKLNDFLKKSAAYTVQQRLISAPIAIIAEKGIDTGAVNAVLAQVRAAGADVPGVLWLDDKWKLASVKDLTALHAAARVTVVHTRDLRPASDGTVTGDLTDFSKVGAKTDGSVAFYPLISDDGDPSLTPIVSSLLSTAANRSAHVQPSVQFVVQKQLEAAGEALLAGAEAVALGNLARQRGRGSGLVLVSPHRNGQHRLAPRFSRSIADTL